MNYTAPFVKEKITAWLKALIAAGAIR